MGLRRRFSTKRLSISGAFCFCFFVRSDEEVGRMRLNYACVFGSWWLLTTQEAEEADADVDVDDDLLMFEW